MTGCGYLLWLSTALSVLALGVGLQCYSCPEGSKKCEKTQQCTGGLNSCLSLKASTGGLVFSKCISFADCDTEKLASSFPISSFTYDCCQNKDLCNSSHSLRASPLIGLLAGAAALWWAMR